MNSKNKRSKKFVALFLLFFFVSFSPFQFSASVYGKEGIASSKSSGQEFAPSLKSGSYVSKAPSCLSRSQLNFISSSKSSKKLSFFGSSNERCLQPNESLTISSMGSLASPLKKKISIKHFRLFVLSSLHHPPTN